MPANNAIIVFFDEKNALLYLEIRKKLGFVHRGTQVLMHVLLREMTTSFFSFV